MRVASSGHFAVAGAESQGPFEGEGRLIALEHRLLASLEGVKAIAFVRSELWSIAE